MEVVSLPGISPTLLERAYDIRQRPAFDKRIPRRSALSQRYLYIQLE